ncbi:brachyurin-like [Anthonomus grandis grandis]|uniref:brachyurin-like n=1 Tax=Anthonomus grandis grandis TaxID=2921223 RepID=UPI0021663CFD|nr:brachyurin-like [Anthonomus grandis grandis]
MFHTTNNKSATSKMTFISSAVIYSCIFIFEWIGKIEGYPTINDTNLVALRITGGKEAIPHSYPYQVGLLLDRRAFCGGVLISTCHVLTAAHCVETASFIEIYLGFHNLKITEDTQKILYNPKVIIHEHYNATSMQNDIAILKLPKSVQFTFAIRPISRMADDDSGFFIGHTGVLSGWGFAYHNSNKLECKLKEVRLDIIANKRCSILWYASRSGISDSQLCTAGSDSIVGNVGACFGDSGGPLVVNDVLVGLVSFGNEICEAGFPTVYTRISKFRYWISKYTGL